MKTKASIIGMIVVFLMASGAYAMMGGGNGMGSSGGYMGGGMGGNHMGGGAGYGMVGVGGMMSGMMGNTMSYGYLDILTPLASADEARTVIQAFIDSSNSDLQISELWEYGTVYKAELSDLNGAKAFDLIADKFTGSVMPEMGFSMMMNASYGRSIYRMPSFRTNINLTPDQAKVYAQSFLGENGLGYTLGNPETYPGYYKFHTTITGSANLGMDIMVNGYDGGISMNSWLGAPIAKHLL
jgi:hypothetical protein